MKKRPKRRQPTKVVPFPPLLSAPPLTNNEIADAICKLWWLRFHSDDPESVRKGLLATIECYYMVHKARKDSAEGDPVC